MSTGSRLAPVLLAVGVLLIAMVSYQCGAALAKQLFPHIGAQGATACRLGLGALILLLLRRPWRRSRPGADWRVLWGYGLAMGMMNLVFYLSLRTIPLGIAVALEFTGPLALALFGSRRLLDFVWIALVVAGLLLLLPLRGQAHELDPLGVAYALAAGVGWALYIVLGQKAGAAYGADAVTLGTSIAALLAIPAGIVHAGGALFSPSLLPLALGVAVLSSALPYSLEMIALTRLPARTFSTLLSIEPAVAAVAGVVFLSERLSLLQWLAIVAIIVAAAGTALSVRKPLAEPLAN
ncbi:transporter [Frateuria sp. Soil773]|uniref:threonine/homoserine exporter RhtA n=1 Tax=Frateuria sp. Soil773 TaxID=1736407 RepID=UPI0006F5397A|nr:threonine/homoserine exporter RhtA [Frateuria sp. Soil773]KRF02183.1 transporter [Frateuria sp. Soil773]